MVGVYNEKWEEKDGPPSSFSLVTFPFRGRRGVCGCLGSTAADRQLGVVTWNSPGTHLEPP